MRFKLDENLGRRGLVAFEVQGHDVSTIHLQGLDGSPDALVYDVCRVEGRVLVTLDLDFANPLVFDPRTTSASQSFACQEARCPPSWPTQSRCCWLPSA